MFETGPLELTAEGWYTITGRGHVAGIINDPPQIPEDMDPSDLLNTKVFIDGRRYFVLGVERQGYSRRNFGLLVRYQPL